MSNYEEDQAIIELEKDQLAKFKNCLVYYVQNLSDGEALCLNVDNSICLSENLDKITSGYDEDAIPLLKEIHKLIPHALDVVQDKTLRSLLSENLQKLEAFFRRFDIGKEKYEEPSKVPQEKYVKEYAQKLSNDLKFVPKMEPSEAWKTLYDSVRKRYTSGVEEPNSTPDVEDFILKSIQRYRERREETERLLKGFNQLHREAELSIDRDPHLYFKEKVLPAICDRIIREGRKRND